MCMEQTEGKYVTDRDLRILCILVYTAVCVGGIFETFWMSCWLIYAPSSKTHGVMKVSENEAGVRCMTADSGITLCVKLGGLIFVLLPKLIVAGVLLTYGGGYVLGAKGNEDLLLNALAVAFIMDLDEIFFRFFLPMNIRSFCSDL
eukprot:UN26976